MSHFTTVETKIKNIACLKSALDDLGIVFTEATQNALVNVKGWRGQELQADMAIHVTGKYDIGVRQNVDGTYGLVADWWGIEEETQEKQEILTQKVLQRYAYHVAKETAEQQGFTIEEQGIEADGTIKMTVTRG